MSRVLPSSKRAPLRVRPRRSARRVAPPGSPDALAIRSATITGTALAPCASRGCTYVRVRRGNGFAWRCERCQRTPGESA